MKLTTHQSILETLSQAHMRRPQRILELGESLVIILAFEVADDAL